MPSQRRLGRGIFLLIISVCVAIPVFAFQNEPDGFRGIKWGTNISQLPDMGLTEDDGGTKYYVKNNDKMKIGDADINQLVYGFYKNRFCVVAIVFDGYSNFSKIKETLVNEYGKPDQPNELMAKYAWYGQTVGLVFEYKDSSKKGEIWHFFIPIKQEEIKDTKEKAKKGTKDF